MSGARLRLSAVAVIAAGVTMVAACTGQPGGSAGPDDGASSAPGASGEATTIATDAPTEIRGGEGACTEALREGPLIDPEDSALGDPPPGAEPLPVVDLPRLDTCELTSTADWVGRPSVLNFWASWCGPCREEMPMLDAFAEANADVVDVRGVTVDFRPVDATDFLDTVDVSFDSWFDPDGQVLARDLSVRTFPTTLFVDANGMIVHRHFGPISVDELGDAVAQHLDVQPAQAPT